MIAGFAISGALLLVLLVGASYSYPAKQGSGATSEMASYPADVQTGSHGVSVNPQNMPQRAPVVHSPSAFVAPIPSGQDSSSSAFQSTSNKDMAWSWAVAPPGLFSGEAESASGVSGPSNVSPPDYFPPEYQAGELSQYEDVYEHGNYESETEEQGFLLPPPGEAVMSAQDYTSEVQPSSPGRSGFQYPYYDYMFLTGQYPPGTFTQSSIDFEQGSDYGQDTEYIRYYYPAEPTTQEVQTFPADQGPQRVKQPSQPINQNAGSTSYDWSGAARQNQPSGAVGQQGAYAWMGSWRQPRRRSPAGGNRKV